MNIRRRLPILFVLIASCFYYGTYAQHTQPLYIKISKKHKALQVQDGSEMQWLELEKAYLKNVIQKNEFILSRKVLTHYMTEDNSEILFVQHYKTWEDIQKAEVRNRVLEAQAWPDAEKRKQYLKDLERYFDNNQSDEFFLTVPGTMEDSSIARKTLYYQLRLNHLAVMNVETDSQFIQLNTSFLEKAVYNNRYIQAYYPFVQVWGSDKRKFMEFTAVESLGDLENAFKEIDIFLYEPTKANEAAHAVFIKNYFSYFTGFHADYIYKSVPALVK